ncbi:MAG: hypothetical protein MK132_02935 [Lentisphaerales bacterium]|nr:hypothetical protein [Lentisphaerales bacterium]
MSKATLPLLIIATGIGWLLSTNNVMPGVDWAWVLVFATVGILALVTKISRFSVVFGPMMLLSSVLMVLMQSKRIAVDQALPVLVIALGVFMLVARSMKFGNEKIEENQETEN